MDSSSTAPEWSRPGASGASDVPPEAGAESASAGAVVEARGLKKRFGQLEALRGVSLSAHRGELVAVIGPNGAGKTTLLRMLAGLTRPEAGDVTRAAPHHWIGHKEGIKPQETPRSHLALWAQAWGSNADIPEILEKMALTRAADVPGRYLSAGQRRRTAFGRLLLEDRPVWLLDEPYTALDAGGKTMLDAVISGHLRSNGAIIASMHDIAGFPVTAEVTL